MNRKGSILLLLYLASLAVGQQSLVVYNGTTGLSSGWDNYSWATVNLANTSPVYPGDRYSASMVCTGWEGLYLSQSINVAPYDTFYFRLNAGSNPSGSGLVLTVQLVASTNSANLGVSTYLPGGTYTANTWVNVAIPMSAFSLTTTQITGFWFQANSNDNTVIYFDDILFNSSKPIPVTGPHLTVNGTSTKIPISPLIYGVTIWWNQDNADYAAFATSLKLPLNRNGGDATTRYNWLWDSSNAGFDWYFMGGSGATNVTPGASVDAFIQQNTLLGIVSTITIPMIEYINNGSYTHCSFPSNLYPNQQSYNPYVTYNGHQCGNGVNSTGSNILDKNPLATDIPNTPAIQTAWVQHIVSKFGNSNKTGIIYQLDNEVSNWAYMHRDVHPQPVTYPEIVNQTIIYANAVKAGDPTAKVAAPSEIQFAWYPDWGGEANIIYFLQQMQAYQTQHGKRIVDMYDCHYPDQNNHWPVLTDVDTIRPIIDSTYPGTGLSFSEWTMAGTGPLGGALATADELGHFAKNQVAWASIWGLADADLTGPISYGLRIYRNYDGKGSLFGDTYLNSTSTVDSQLSVHSALRSSDGALTILVINKITSAISAPLALSGFSPKSPAQVFQYSSANLTAIVQEPALPVNATGFTTTYAAQSLTLIIIPHS